MLRSIVRRLGRWQHWRAWVGEGRILHRAEGDLLCLTFNSWFVFTTKNVRPQSANLKGILTQALPLAQRSELAQVSVDDSLHLAPQLQFVGKYHKILGPDIG